MKTPHQLRIEQFMRLAGHILPDNPTIPNVETRRLCAKLILEEALETVTALGFGALMVNKTNWQVLLRNMDGVDVCEICEPDLIEIADGCADTSVVATFTLSACGIADNRLLEIVDESNLAKFGPGSYKREDGKWMKPPGWVAPNIKELLQ